MRKKRADALDDGRVVSSMNIEGMPWYSPRRTPLENSTGESTGVPEKMTRQENMAFAFGVLKAVLLVAIALIGGYFAFIWFCVNIWFR